MSDAVNPGVLPWCGIIRNTPNLCSMGRGTAHINLAIEVDSDPISGCVSNGNQLAQPFIGWIELVEAIEAARASDHAGEPEGEAR